MTPGFITVSESLTLATRGKGTYEITRPVAQAVKQSGIKNGTITVFIAHTSASLVIYENADATARADLHKFFEKLVPEKGDYAHDSEGPDDSTSHLRMALTRSSEVIPVIDGKLALGTWQGIFVFEHRSAPHQRTVHLSIIGA